MRRAIGRLAQLAQNAQNDRGPIDLPTDPTKSMGNHSLVISWDKSVIDRVWHLTRLGN
jgi:hypothetical protein